MKEMNFSAPLVSVVVPVYRVERYISVCIESICRQTYANLEIIVVDDGSPDSSGEIADELAIVDSRIRVIHTENRGVSAARNLGLDSATGVYVAFVDGDDQLEVDFVEYMLRVVDETGAHFVMSKNCFTFPGEAQVDDDSIDTYSPEHAASELLLPCVEIGCWNKLFLRKFLESNNIRFPESFHMGEGLNFIVQSAQLSNFVGVGARKVYRYRKDNENSATTKISVDKFINALSAIDNIERNSIVSSKEFDSALRLHRYLTTFWALNAIVRTGAKRTFPGEFARWARCVRNDAFCVMKCRVNPVLKLRVLLFCLSPVFFLTCRFYAGRAKRRFLSGLFAASARSSAG